MVGWKEQQQLNRQRDRKEVVVLSDEYQRPARKTFHVKLSSTFPFAFNENDAEIRQCGTQYFIGVCVALTMVMMICRHSCTSTDPF